LIVSILSILLEAQASNADSVLKVMNAVS